MIDGGKGRGVVGPGTPRLHWVEQTWRLELISEHEAAEMKRWRDRFEILQDKSSQESHKDPNPITPPLLLPKSNFTSVLSKTFPFC